MFIAEKRGEIDEEKAKISDLFFSGKVLKKGGSGQATEFLKANGFEDVHNGGGWREVKEVMDA